MEAVNNPEDAGMGTRKVPFSRELLHRAGRFPRGPAQGVSSASRPGRKCGCATPISSRCTDVVKDPQTRRGHRGALHLRSGHRGGNTPDGRKVKGTIHWVSAAHAVRAEVRLYEHLFTKPNPDDVPGGPGLQGQPQPELAAAIDGLLRSSRACRARRRAAGSSSSGWATSASTRTRPPSCRSSTARSRCAIPGRRSRRPNRSEDHSQRGQAVAADSTHPAPTPAVAAGLRRRGRRPACRDIETVGSRPSIGSRTACTWSPCQIPLRAGPPPRCPRRRPPAAGSRPGCTAPSHRPEPRREPVLALEASRASPPWWRLRSAE